MPKGLISYGVTRDILNNKQIDVYKTCKKTIHIRLNNNVSFNTVLYRLDLKYYQQTRPLLLLRPNLT